MPGSFGVARRELYEALPSTQDRAIELARDGAEEGSVVVARPPSRGRGRGDRTWASPDGGLYLSVVLRPPTPLPGLPLALGAELARAISEAYGVRLRLKWPNDLLAIDGAGEALKLAGILVDLVRSSSRGWAAVAGIGVNARRPAAGWPPDASARPVALEELAGAPVDLDRLESVVVRSVREACRALAEAAGERTLLARVRGLLYGAGETVTVDGRTVGRLRGVRDDGSLEVDGPDGVRALLAGDVRVGVGR